MAPCMSHENRRMAMSAPQNVAVWFEIPAANFERAVGFYEKVFDTKLTRDHFGPMEMAVFPHEATAISGCVMKGEGYNCLLYTSDAADE